jgi:hypothetical protein
MRRREPLWREGARAAHLNRRRPRPHRLCYRYATGTATSRKTTALSRVRTQSLTAYPASEKADGANTAPQIQQLLDVALGRGGGGVRCQHPYGPRELYQRLTPTVAPQER